MKYKLRGHRHALSVVTETEFCTDWAEFKTVLDSITDEMLIQDFERFNAEAVSSGKRKAMSLSRSINALIDEGLVGRGWTRQSKIFGDARFVDKKWTLDFAKKTPGEPNGGGTFSVEVAFNNAGSMAWNLIKPVLASELNHVSKAVQTQIGIIVFATESLKKAGCFDNTVGTFELAQDHLAAMQNILVTPIVLVGLEAPESFVVEEERDPQRDYKYGRVVRV
jgi:hypothetical protein